MFFINLIGLAYTAFMCLALRFHYVIDVTCGILIGHWAFLLVEKYEPKLNEIFGKM